MTLPTVLKDSVRAYQGRPISEPGIWKGVGMEAYHGPDLCNGPSISRSGLWRIFDMSLAHYYDGSPYNPRAEKWSESEALVLGRAAHHGLLGEEAFSEHFAIRPDEFDSWRTKASQAWRQEQWDAGKSVLEPKHMEAIEGMHSGLVSHPLVRAGILNGLIEHTVVAQDPQTKVWLKIRPDCIPNDSGDFSDLKTTADISDDGITQAIGRDGLFMQGALTMLVCEMVGIPFHSFSLVFVEKSSPFCARVVTLKDADLELGIKAIRAALYEFARAMDRHVWPGPGGEQTDGQYVEMKPWARKRAEDRIAIMEATR